MGSRFLTLIALSLTVGCTTPFSVKPKPSEGLLTPCPDVVPYLVPDPEHATSEQINVERVRVAEWGDCYRGKFEDLSTWVREVLGK